MWIRPHSSVRGKSTDEPFSTNTSYFYSERCCTVLKLGEQKIKLFAYPTLLVSTFTTNHVPQRVFRPPTERFLTIKRSFCTTISSLALFNDCGATISRRPQCLESKSIILFVFLSVEQLYSSRRQKFHHRFHILI